MSNKNANKPGYKHTLLGWIPEEWEVKELRELGTFKGGGTPNTNIVRYWNGGIPWVSPKDMKCDEIFETQDYITKEAVAESSTNLISKNSILIVTRSGILRNSVPIALNRVPVAINQDLKSFEPRNKDSVAFIFQYLKYKNNQLLMDASKVGTTVESLDFDALRNFTILFPNLSEQLMISKILGEWDQAISTTRKLIAELQKRNKGLMQQLLTPKRAWKTLKLSDVFDRVTRKNEEGNSNVVTISAQRGFIKQGDFFNKIVASDILDNYFLVYKGEFCYNKSYSNGYNWGAIKRLNDFAKAVVTSLYICFRIKNEKIFSGNFFESFFDACLLDKGLSKIAHEGGRAHGLLNVTPFDFFELKIQVPEYDEQLRTSDILSIAKRELNVFQDRLTALKQQKKALMQKLLTGEIRVKTPETVV